MQQKCFSLQAFDIGIDTHQELVAYMRRDSHVCSAEGFSASSRIQVSSHQGSIIATLNIVDNDVLETGHVGLSKAAMKRLQVSNGDPISVSHGPVLKSLSYIRKKIFGHGLSAEELQEIIADISALRYSDIEIASFISVCAGGRLNLDEIIGLTSAMVATGERLHWPHQQRIFDKHCIGGLPGNRTTPLVVAIASAAGLVMPKTSSRAITSPAGTADTMETLMKVDLGLEDMRRVVAETGACLAWGGAVSLSPADDVLIRIERALDLDGEGQLIASVLSKKIAAGSTHAVIDIPVGETAKVRSRAEADRLATLFTEVGKACGIQLRCVITDGSAPVGRGIGPVEEARDLLAVLQGLPEAPRDLRERGLLLASHLLDMANQAGLEQARTQAEALLDSGQAWQQFQKIAEAQGGLKKLPEAKYQHTETVPYDGVLRGIDNRKLARLAKLAGAPFSPEAGLRLHASVGEHLQAGAPLFTLFSATRGEQDYALDFYETHRDLFLLTQA